MIDCDLSLYVLYQERVNLTHNLACLGYFDKSLDANFLA